MTLFFRLALFIVAAWSSWAMAAQTFAQDASSGTAQLYLEWTHHGSIFLNTTPDGADLPESAVVEKFPVLVRLHKEFFDFSQTQPNGDDLRFSLSTGETLAYQIESWDADAGTACVWVLVPRIQGNSQQELHLHWGNSQATSESRGSAVFSEANGFASVLHMDHPVQDATGALELSDQGTTATSGIIGSARQLAGGQGVFCGDMIESLPIGSDANSTHAWFRPQIANARVLGWGNEAPQGKVILDYRSPASVQMECYFSSANIKSTSAVPLDDWVHVVHTYQKGESLLYIDGVLDAAHRSDSAPLNVKRPARMWIGGWYNDYRFVGDIDEVRISKVVRSKNWVRLEYENQKPLQMLTGHVVQSGDRFTALPKQATILEGSSTTFSTQAQGAQKVYWLVRSGEHERVAATDQLDFTFDAGRVTNDQTATLIFKALYADEVRTSDCAITIKEELPDPVFSLQAPSTWNGRDTIEVTANVTNRVAMRNKGVDELKLQWSTSGLATIEQSEAEKLILKRSQNSGTLTVTATLSNGGGVVSKHFQIEVTEPLQDAWLPRTPAAVEQPVDNQFYARDGNNKGTLHCNGTLTQPADAVFLRLYADDKLVATEQKKPDSNNGYALSVKLKPGLIQYRIEFGSSIAGTETILHTASNILCGDAYIIQGQSNALATDTHEESPPETNQWIRSYGNPSNDTDKDNRWCHPVWKARRGEQAELGYWGMELAKRMVNSRQIPLCVFNGAVGGTRIDQHQRNEDNPTDLGTIYGRLLWRVQQAKLTHGIRAVLWHQGESDQGADGPDGGFGWETYQDYFVAMSAAWKQDYPNIQKYYVFQIFPNACSMGNGHGDMLREVQRTLPRLYANLDVIATLGVDPPGGCHYPLIGWAKFADLVQPLMERDFDGKRFEQSITSPSFMQARFTSSVCDEIAIQFDQPVIWDDVLISEFYLDGEKAQVESGSASGNSVTLKLKTASTAKTLSYLKEQSWSQQRILKGLNGLTALTFCNVPIADQQ